MRTTFGGKEIPWEHYLRLALRQRWLLITPMLFGIAALSLYSFTLKDQYQAKATILVEPQSIPTEFMRSTLPYGPEKYVRSLVDQIKSVTRLERIILEYNLYAEARANLTMEEVVNYMRERIQIERRENDTFSVTFMGDDPQTVQAVTNRLTDMFIEENLRYRLERSAQNVAFLKGEAKKLRDQLSVQERQIQEYKSGHLDKLPENLLSIQAQLNAARQRLESTSQALSSARSRTLSARDRVALLSSAGEEVVSEATPTPHQLQLEKARQELAQLRAQFSDQHPDVQTKEKEVAALSALVASEPKGASPQRRRRSINPELLRSTDEARLADSDAVRLEGEQVRLQKEIVSLTERLEQVPRIELELSELTKGLKVLQEQADTYDKKANEAQGSYELERQNQGSQFRALDRARVPSKPVSPNRPMLILIGGLAGLALGLGMIIGLDILFRPFLEEQDLAEYAQLPVLVSIPQIGPVSSEWQRLRGQLSLLLGMILESLPFARESYAPGRAQAPAGGAGPVMPQLRPVEELAPPVKEAPIKGFTYLLGDPVASNRGARPVSGTAGSVTLAERNGRTDRRSLNGLNGGGAHRREEPRQRAAESGIERPARSEWNGAAELPGRSLPKSPRVSGEHARVQPPPPPETALEASEQSGVGFHVRLGHGGDRVKVETEIFEDGSMLKAAFTGARPKKREEIAELLARAAGEGGRRRSGSARSGASTQGGTLIPGPWGNPQRYRVTARLQLTEDSAPDETLKELYRRPPWQSR